MSLAVTNLDFIIPGHRVEEQENSRVTLTKRNPQTGSSIAIALAAGLAALMIHCVRLYGIRNNKLNLPNDAPLKNIKLRMKKTFQDMAKEREGIQKYVDVWGTFYQASEAFKAKKDERREAGKDEKRLQEIEDSKLEIVKKLAQKWII